MAFFTSFVNQLESKAREVIKEGEKMLQDHPEANSDELQLNSTVYIDEENTVPPPTSTSPPPPPPEDASLLREDLVNTSHVSSSTSSHEEVSRYKSLLRKLKEKMENERMESNQQLKEVQTLHADLEFSNQQLLEENAQLQHNLQLLASSQAHAQEESFKTRNEVSEEFEHKLALVRNECDERLRNEKEALCNEHALALRVMQEEALQKQLDLVQQESLKARNEISLEFEEKLALVRNECNERLRSEKEALCNEQALALRTMQEESLQKQLDWVEQESLKVRNEVSLEFEDKLGLVRNECDERLRNEKEALCKEHALALRAMQEALNVQCVDTCSPMDATVELLQLEVNALNLVNEEVKVQCEQWKDQTRLLEVQFREVETKLHQQENAFQVEKKHLQSSLLEAEDRLVKIKDPHVPLVDSVPMEDLQFQIMAQELEIQAWQEERNTLRGQMEHQTKEMEGVHAQVMNLQQECATYQATVSTLKEQVEKVTLEWTTQTELVESLRSDLQHQEIQLLDQHKEEVSRLQTAWEDVKSKLLEEAKQGSQQFSVDQQEEINRLVGAHKDREEHLLGELASSQNRVHHVESELTQVQTELSTCQDQLRLVVSEKDDCVRQHDEAIRLLQSELTRVQTELTADQARLLSEKDDCIGQHEEAIRLVQSELTRVQTELTTCQEQLRLVESEKNDCARQHEEAIRLLQSELTRVQTELTTGQAQLLSEKDDCVRQHEEAIRSLQSEVDSISAKANAELVLLEESRLLYHTLMTEHQVLLSSKEAALAQAQFTLEETQRDFAMKQKVMEEEHANKLKSLEDEFANFREKADAVLVATALESEKFEERVEEKALALKAELERLHEKAFHQQQLHNQASLQAVQEEMNIRIKTATEHAERLQADFFLVQETLETELRTTRNQLQSLEAESSQRIQLEVQQTRDALEVELHFAQNQIQTLEGTLAESTLERNAVQEEMSKLKLILAQLQEEKLLMAQTSDSALHSQHLWEEREGKLMENSARLEKELLDSQTLLEELKTSQAKKTQPPMSVTQKPQLRARANSMELELGGVVGVVGVEAPMLRTTPPLPVMTPPVATTTTATTAAPSLPLQLRTALVDLMAKGDLTGVSRLKLTFGVLVYSVLMHLAMLSLWWRSCDDHMDAI